MTKSSFAILAMAWLGRAKKTKHESDRRRNSMTKSLFAFLALTLIPACVYAVDGVGLISQATVNAAGGFPYVISQPGSYKLSGNLAAPINKNAIEIAASFVSLDLNGFNISCIADLGKVVNCVTDRATVAGFTIFNGGIKTDLTAISFDVITISAINISSPYSNVHDLVILTAQSGSGPGVTLGSFSSVRRNTVIGNTTCGAFCSATENVFTRTPVLGAGSVTLANVSI
jgi:hypothetical protein